MKYRAELRGVPNLDRPVITHSESDTSIGDWAKNVLAKYPPSRYPDAYVIVSMHIDHPTLTWRRVSDDNTIIVKKGI